MKGVPTPLPLPPPPLPATERLSAGLKEPLGLTDGEAPTLRLGVALPEIVLLGVRVPVPVPVAEGEALAVGLRVPGAVGVPLGETEGLAPTVRLGVALLLVVEEALSVEVGV